MYKILHWAWLCRAHSAEIQVQSTQVNTHSVQAHTIDVEMLFQERGGGGGISPYLLWRKFTTGDNQLRRVACDPLKHLLQPQVVKILP